MKGNIKQIKLIKGQELPDNLIAAIAHIAVAIISFTASRATVLTALTPFGLSFIAGCPEIFTAAAATGAFLGYFFPAINGGAFRYIAALFAILSIKLLLSGYKKISSNPLFLSGLAFLSCMLTSLFSSYQNGFALAYRFAEALLCAGATFFIYKTARAVLETPIGLNSEEMTSLIVVINILLMGMAGKTLGGISLAHILSVALILVAARFGGVLAGSISGITVAFSFLLSGDGSEITASFALAGMTAGFFYTLGKYAQVCAVILITFTASLAMGISVASVSVLIEIIVSCALFLMLPRSIGIYLGRIFSLQPKITAPTSFKKALTMRLTLAANALNDVSETVEQVSRELGKINTPDFGTVLSRIEQDACKGCKFRMGCWENRREETVSAVFEMTKAVKAGEISPESFSPDDFKARCLRLEAMGSCVYKHYSEYAAKISAENRIDEVRSVVTDQFDGISKMLKDLSYDFENDVRYDNALAAAAVSALKNINIRAVECSCRIDKFGRATLEFKVRKTSGQKFNKMQIMKLLSLVCEREFEPPVFSEAGNDIYIMLNEKAVYKIDFGVHQLTANGSAMCGDAYNSFYDGRGHFIIILSDGMGTGGRAAVDGAMASGLMMRLLKAGFGYDCSLRILNSSMLFKSTDESLATLDIVSIDLYTGTAELYKAGAAPTLVRRSGRTGKAESTSLPAGILRDIGFDYATIKMKKGDIVLMLSDGAVSEGTEWIRSELEAAEDISAADLAERICEYARRRHTDRHDDDITVIAAIIEKSY